MCECAYEVAAESNYHLCQTKASQMWRSISDERMLKYSTCTPCLMKHPQLPGTSYKHPSPPLHILLYLHTQTLPSSPLDKEVHRDRTAGAGPYHSIHPVTLQGTWINTVSVILWSTQSKKTKKKNIKLNNITLKIVLQTVLNGSSSFWTAYSECCINRVLVLLQDIISILMLCKLS